MTDNNDNDQNKLRWLRPMMNGDDDGVLQALLSTLPSSESLSGDDLKRMDVARNYMAELFLRGVSLDRFRMDSGLTGFPIDPKEPGLARTRMMGSYNPSYFRFWQADNDAEVSARAIQNILLSRQSRMAPEHQAWFRMQLCIDVDNNAPDETYALELGLTPKAVCLEFNLNEAESAFPSIRRACHQLSAQAHSKLRISLGSFGQQEYEGMSKMSLYSKRMPYTMGSEFVLFKNIRRRAGKFAWFWKMVANRRDRKDIG